MSVTMKTTRKMKKSTCAICTAPPAIPVKPKSAATRAITKKMTAQVNMANPPLMGLLGARLISHRTAPPRRGESCQCSRRGLGRPHGKGEVQLVFHEKNLSLLGAPEIARKLHQHKILGEGEPRCGTMSPSAWIQVLSSPRQTPQTFM